MLNSRPFPRVPCVRCSGDLVAVGLGDAVVLRDTKANTFVPFGSSPLLRALGMGREGERERERERQRDRKRLTD